MTSSTKVGGSEWQTSEDFDGLAESWITKITTGFTGRLYVMQVANREPCTLAPSSSVRTRHACTFTSEVQESSFPVNCTDFSAALSSIIRIGAMVRSYTHACESSMKKAVLSQFLIDPG